MFDIDFAQVIIKGIPEGLLIFLGLYIISGISFDKDKILVSGLLYSIITYCIRLLPISFGIHTLIIFFFVVLVSRFFNGIEISDSIKSTLIMDMCILLCELINILLLQSIFGEYTQVILQDTFKKTIYSTPSTIILAIIIFVIYKFRKRGLKDGKAC